MMDARIRGHVLGDYAPQWTDMTTEPQAGPPIMQQLFAPAGASWNFEKAPGQAANHSSSASPAHQDPYSQASQVLSTPPEHRHMQSREAFAMKQEIFTPTQVNLSGRNGSHISISSDGGWSSLQGTPFQGPQKRPGSPIIQYGQVKRQQMYQSPIQPSRPMSAATKQLFIDQDQPHPYPHFTGSPQFHSSSPQTHLSSPHFHQSSPQGYPQDIGQGSRQSLLSYPQQSPGFHRSPLSRQFGDPEPYSPHHPPTQMFPSHYHQSPHMSIPVEEVSSPQHPQQPMPMPASTTPQVPLPRHVESYVQSIDRLRTSSQSSRADPLEGCEQRRRRAKSAHPGNVQKPQLGSPIHFEKTTMKTNSTGRASETSLNGGRSLETRHHNRDIETIPVTPQRQRDKTPHLSARRVHTKERNIKSMKARTQEVTHQQTSDDAASDDTSTDGTPLNVLWCKQQKQGNVARDNFDMVRHRAGSVLVAREGVFRKKRFKSQAPSSSRVSTPLKQRIRSSSQRPPSTQSRAASRMRSPSQNPYSSLTRAHTRIATPKPQANVPPSDIIDLCSPSESVSSPPPATICSVPMKDRIALAAKPPSKKSTLRTTAVANVMTPKTPKKLKSKPDEEVDPTIARQKHVAEIIISKEIQGKAEAREIAMFGEVLGLSEEEKLRRAEEMRAEAERKQMIKEREQQAREEAEELAEMERVRAQAERSERERIAKEIEEDRAKIRREAERKRIQALEVQELDKLREKTAEKILGTRQKDAEGAEERERLKREAKEKAEKVQADKEELAKLKAKQEEAKKQAASLNFAKITTSDDGESVGKDGDVSMQEETLFVSQSPPRPSRVARDKSVGPSNAAELFAQAGSKSAALSSYRAEREDVEMQKQKLATAAQLTKRWKRLAANKAKNETLQSKPEPRRERSQPPKTGRSNSSVSKDAASQKETQKDGASKTTQIDSQLKSRATSILSPPPSSDYASSPTSPSPQPNPHPSSQPVQHDNSTSENTSFKSTKSAPAALPQTTAVEFKSQPGDGVVLLSDLERQMVEAQQRQKEEREASFKRRDAEQKKKAREAESRAAAKAARDQKAREKQKQKLVDMAKEAGLEMTVEDLDDQLNQFMDNREVKLQKRNEKIARRDANRSFERDILAKQIRPQTSDAEEEDFTTETTEEQRIRKENAALRGARKSRCQQRAPAAFVRAAQKKTVADFIDALDSSESEEDPDLPPPPKAVNIASEGDDGNVESEESDEDEDENQGVVAAPSQNAPEMERTEALHNDTQKKNLAQISSLTNDLMNNQSGSDLYMVYSVIRQLIFNGIDKPEFLMGQFLSLTEANKSAASLVQALRNRPIKSISEGYDDDNLYFATVVYDQGVKNQAYFYVRAVPTMKEKISHQLDISTAEERLPERSYLVIQYTSQRRVDEETGEIHIHHDEPEALSHFSQLHMANQDACSRLTALLKPPGFRIDDHMQHADTVKQLIENRENFDKEKKLFAVEAEKNEKQLQWLPFSSIRMEVQLFEMQGPRN